MMTNTGCYNMVTDIKNKKNLDDYKHGSTHAREGIKKMFPDNEDYSLGYDRTKARLQLKELGVLNEIQVR